MSRKSWKPGEAGISRQREGYSGFLPAALVSLGKSWSCCLLPNRPEDTAAAGRKRPNCFLSIIQRLELPGAPAGAGGKSWREHLPLGHLGWSQGGTWGRDRQPGLCSAGTSVLCLDSRPHGPFSCPPLFSLDLCLTTWAGPGFGPTPSLQLQSLLLNMMIAHSLGESIGCPESMWVWATCPERG